MAKAQTLAWLLARKADFGMSPPLDGIADDVDSRLQLRLESRGLDRTPARLIGKTGLLRELAGHLRRDEIDHRGLEGLGLRSSPTSP